MRGTAILIGSCGLALFSGAVALSWSASPYWMDAEEYASTVSQGRWVVHPPGHLFLVALGRLLHASGVTDPHTGLQALTLLSTLAGALLLYRLLREVVGPPQASLLAAAFGLSWVPLLINHTGTSSTSDLFTVPLLLGAAVRLTTPAAAASATSAAGQKSSHVWGAELLTGAPRLALAVILCGGFRLTTLFMMGPMLVAVLWVNRRSRAVWGACAAGALVVGLLQVLVIRMSGGWHLYSFMVWKQNFFRSYNLIDDIAHPALFNAGRSLLWFTLATFGLPLGLAFALLRPGSAQPWSRLQRLTLLYGALATAGPVAVCTLYLCEHPGYLAPALAGFYLCVAVAWNRADDRRSFAKWPIAAIVASLALFFGMRYYREPSSRRQAFANYLLLQYSADAARAGCYKTTSEWLRASEASRLGAEPAEVGRAVKGRDVDR